MYTIIRLDNIIEKNIFFNSGKRKKGEEEKQNA